MAAIAPFRGILYAPAAGAMGALWAPPYDVISAQERDHLLALDLHNCVRLILPEGEDDQKYARAARDLEAWRQAGILERDAAPAFYRYHQRFDTEGGTVTRKGFICRLRLSPFSDGVVLPHERTLAGPKIDRLKLWRATRAQLSQVFGLYADPGRETDAPFAAVEATPPCRSGRTGDGVEHLLWRLTDPTAQATLVRLLADAKVYIADGHHRYETMLALRDELRAASGGRPQSSIEYGTVFLANMDDPGLLVFPTHRVVEKLRSFDRSRLVAEARRYFNVSKAPLGEATTMLAELRRRGQAQPSFALVSEGELYFLTLRSEVSLDAVAALAGPAVLRRLDVTLLHALVLEEILGIDRAAQEQKLHLRYVKDAVEALRLAHEPNVQAVFLMNPTPVSEVRAVADAGQVMPQKSTYFYPKLASGLVINPVALEEDV